MKTKLIISICLLTSPFTALAKKKEYPRAEIKVGYTYNETFVRGSDGIIKREIPFVLLANKEQSKFYSPKTEFKDSLQSTPQGRVVEKELFNDAIKRYMETKDGSAMSSVVYQTFLYVFRSKPDNEITLYDKPCSSDPALSYTVISLSGFERKTYRKV